MYGKQDPQKIEMVKLFQKKIKLSAQMATYTDISLLWKTMGGNDFGSISSSSSTSGLYEIFINLDQFRMFQLQPKQIAIIWNYFRYINNVYPNASLCLFEKENHEQCIHINLGLDT